MALVAWSQSYKEKMILRLKIKHRAWIRFVVTLLLIEQRIKKMLSEYVSELHQFKDSILFLVFILFLSGVDIAGYLIV